jgi:nucleotide-binding universal stress UspA family protein
MKFLVAYDGTSEAKAALNLAAEHAKIFGAGIVVLSSSEGGIGEKPEKIAEINSDLEQVAADMAAAAVPCEIDQMARGLSPGEDAVRLAADTQIDMAYVGIRKKSKTMKLFLGSTAQYIILKAGCPVVTVK